MKREIYLIRHGATALNAESGGVDRIRGWKNIPLSSEGRRQVKELAKTLRESGLTLLVSSSLSRAHDTADAIARTTRAGIIVTDALKPWDVGEYTGKESDMVHPVMMEYAANKPEKALPGGESFEQFKSRAFHALRAYLLHDKSDVIGLVTHSRVERLVKAWIAAGSRPDKTINFETMFTRGEGTAHCEKLGIDLDALEEMT